MLRDPFSADNEASLYVPRHASEDALARLLQAICSGPGVATLMGPAGIGKSMLLKVLDNRLAADHCCVRVEYEGLSSAELCHWVLRELDARETLETERVLNHRPALAKFREWVQRERSYTDTDDPEQALVQLAAEFQSRGFPVVLLIDSADALKAETAQRLVDLTQRASGALSLIFTITEGLPETPSLLEGLGSANVTVVYEIPMSLEETILYIKERLSKAQASDELRACLDESRIRRLFKYSQGNPRRLHGEVGLIHLELSRVRAGIPMQNVAYVPVQQTSPVEPPRPWLVHPPEVLAPDAGVFTEASATIETFEPTRAEAVVEPAPSSDPITDPEIEAALSGVAPTPVAGAGEAEAREWTAPESAVVDAAAETTILDERTPESSNEPDILLDEQVEAEATEVSATPSAPPAEVLETSEEPAPHRRKERITRLFERAVSDGWRSTRLSGETSPKLSEPEPEPALEPSEPEVLVTAVEVLAEEEAAIQEPELAVIEVEPAPLQAVHEAPTAAPSPLPDAVDSPELRDALVSPDAETAPELFAEARRDWEQFSRSSTPLSQLQLPQVATAPVPGPPAAVVPPKPRGSLQAFGLAAALIVAIGLGGLAIALSSGPDKSLPDVGAPTLSEPSAPVAESEVRPNERTAPGPVLGSENATTNAAVIDPPAALVLTNINAKPWATIEIDGRLVGETPLGELPLTEGPHLFRATLPGNRVIERTEMISPDNSRIVFE